MTTTELAQLLHVRQSSVSRWENDEAMPSPKVLYSLMELAQEPEKDILFRAFTLQLARPNLDYESFQRLLSGEINEIPGFKLVTDHDEVFKHERTRKYAHELLDEIFSSGTFQDADWIVGNLKNFVEAIRSRTHSKKRDKVG